MTKISLIPHPISVLFSNTCVSVVVNLFAGRDIIM